MKIYLGAPFFNPAQLKLVEELEDIFSAHQVFSPRKEGIMTNMTPEERRSQARRLFKQNVDNIDWCDILLAVIDDRDVGVMFELGYAFARGRDIVTFTNQSYGLNIMISECSQVHLQGLDEARRLAALLTAHGLSALDGEFSRAEAAT